MHQSTFSLTEKMDAMVYSLVKFVQILIYALAILLYLQPYIAHAIVFSDST